MKKIILAFIIAVGSWAPMQAQLVQFGFKGGLNFAN